MLVDAASADEYLGRAVEWIGIELVRMRFLETESLAASIRVIGDGLPALAGSSERAIRRMPKILASLVTGFNEAISERGLEDQQPETVRAAVMDARRGAHAALRASE